MFKTLASLLVATAAAVLLPATQAGAQGFPVRPIKVITPFPAGQGPDVLLRMVTDRMAATLGQPVIVDNKPGASGFIAFETAKRSANDGYTLVHMDSFHVGTHPHLFNKLPYSAFKDFDPITPLVRNHFFVVVPATSRFQSMGDLIAAAKASPGRVSYGSWGVATPAHLGGLLLEAATGTEMLHVPFKESALLYQSVGTGEVDWAIGSPASASAVLQSGRARLLAVAAPKRTAGHDKVPTAAEAGAPTKWLVGGWNGLLAPAGTPQPVIRKLHEAIEKAMQTPEVKDKLAVFTYEAYTMPPADMAKLMQQEVDNWGPAIKASKIKLD